MFQFLSKTVFFKLGFLTSVEIWKLLLFRWRMRPSQFLGVSLLLHLELSSLSLSLCVCVCVCVCVHVCMQRV